MAECPDGKGQGPVREKIHPYANPTDGHWVRAIFGESEPAPTKKNRETWKKAAEKQQSQVIREHMGE